MWNTIFSIVFGTCVWSFAAYLAVRTLYVLKDRRPSWHKEIGMDWGLVSGVVVVWALLFPTSWNAVFYRGAYVHFTDMAVVVIALLMALYGLCRFKGENWFRLLARGGRMHEMEEMPGLGVFLIIASVCLLGGGLYVVNTVETYRLSLEHRPEEIHELLKPDVRAFWRKPRQTAHQQMLGKLPYAEFTIELEHVEPTPVGEDFFWVAEVTGDGPLNLLIRKNFGFRWVNDSQGGEQDERRQNYQVGEEMMFFDNVYRALYYKDRTAYFPEVFPLSLDPEDREKFTLVAPRIEYRYQWGGAFPVAVPHMTGLAVIPESYPEQEIELLSFEQMVADSRFGETRTWPHDLVRAIADSQRYDEGWVSGLWKRPGQIEVPDLEGYNQLPFLVKMQDGHWYYVTVCEPAGEAFSLLRIYYQRMPDGKLTFIDLSKASFFGPRKCADFVKGKLPNVSWAEKTKEGSTEGFRVIEPCYVVRADGTGEDIVWWKYSIVSNNYAAVAAIAVVNSRSGDNPDNVLIWKSPEKFDRWLTGENLASDDLTTQELFQATGADRLREAASTVIKALDEIESKGSPKE